MKDLTPLEMEYAKKELKMLKKAFVVGLGLQLLLYVCSKPLIPMVLLNFAMILISVKGIYRQLQVSDRKSRFYQKIALGITIPLLALFYIASAVV